MNSSNHSDLDIYCHKYFPVRAAAKRALEKCDKLIIEQRKHMRNDDLHIKKNANAHKLNQHISGKVIKHTEDDTRTHQGANGNLSSADSGDQSSGDIQQNSDTFSISISNHQQSESESNESRTAPSPPDPIEPPLGEMQRIIMFDCVAGKTRSFGTSIYMGGIVE